MSEVEETRIMGLDYGKVRIGISLSDPLKTFAYSFIALRNDNNLINELEKIIKEKSIIKIVLGIPNENRETSTSVVNEIIKFKNNLELKFNIEVILWDETYTSVMASDKILESVSSKKKRRNKSLIDMNSASIILQEYLDSEKRNN
jgi:putative Holliday junction resolvase